MTSLQHTPVWQIRSSADELAAQVLDQYWTGALPIDPVQIARQMGVEVFSAQLGNDVFGCIIGTPEGAQIYVDIDQPITRYRFTTAHELGHYVEHAERAEAEMSYVDRRTDEDRGKPEEVFANQFAGALLMPERALRLFGPGPGNDVAAADRLGVSLAALRYRRKVLGL